MILFIRLYVIRVRPKLTARDVNVIYSSGNNSNNCMTVLVVAVVVNSNNCNPSLHCLCEWSARSESLKSTWKWLMTIYAMNTSQCHLVIIQFLVYFQGKSHTFKANPLCGSRQTRVVDYSPPRPWHVYSLVLWGQCYYVVKLNVYSPVKVSDTISKHAHVKELASDYNFAGLTLPYRIRGNYFYIMYDATKPKNDKFK